MAAAHVVPSGSAWLVKVNGVERSRHSTQNAAWDAARDYLAANGGGELNIHGTDGTIRAKDTIHPGNDPRNVRG